MSERVALEKREQIFLKARQAALEVRGMTMPLLKRLGDRVCAALWV